MGISLWLNTRELLSKQYLHGVNYLIYKRDKINPFGFGLSLLIAFLVYEREYNL